MSSSHKTNPEPSMSDYAITAMIESMRLFAQYGYFENEKARADVVAAIEVAETHLKFSKDLTREKIRGDHE